MWDRIALKIKGKQIEFLHRNNGKYLRATATVPELEPNKWYEIIATFSRKTGMTVYLNKKIISFNHLMNFPSSWSLYYIGASGHPEKIINSFNGWISEVLVYNCEINS